MQTNALDAAFRATTYRVTTPVGVFDLRIGQIDRGFDDFLCQRGASRWCIVTACNPGGALCAEGNPARHARFSQRLGESGLENFPACNIADDGSWPDEPGFLILNPSERQACRLAAEFAQLAVVCGACGAPPHLVWV